MSVNKMFFASGGDNYNLEIGGVSSTINTPALLATYFTFNESDIQKFEIDGSDIMAYVSGVGYTFVLSAFQDNANITKCVIKNNIVNLFSADVFFRSSISYFEADANTLLRLNSRIFAACSMLSYDNIKINNLDVNNSLSLESTFSNTLSSGNGVLDLTNVTNISRSTAYATFAHNVSDGKQKTVDFSKVTNLDITSATVLQRRMFKLYSGKVRLWSCTDLMPTYSSSGSVVSGVFAEDDASTTMTIEINVIQKTINGGNPHADLVDAENRGATVIYTDSNGVPQP